MNEAKIKALFVLFMTCGLMTLGFTNCSDVSFSEADGGPSVTAKGVIDEGDLAGEPISEDNAEELQDILDEMGEDEEHYHDDEDMDDVADCGKKNGKKVLICHFPPGNPANYKTLCISINAIDAHKNHGGDREGQLRDFVGSCDEIDDRF